MDAKRKLLNRIRLFPQARRNCCRPLQLLLLFTICLCLWPSLAQAEIIRVDPNQPPPSILSSTELEKLAILQNTSDLFLFSGVSPDDRSVVFAAAPLGSAEGGEPEPPQVSFLGIEDGSLQPIDPMFLMLSPQTEVVWREAQTAVYVSSNETGEPVLVTLDRETGAVESSELSLPGRPISLAPGGMRLLIEVSTDKGITLTAVDLATGAHEPLLDYPQGGTPSSIAWSAGGAKLALVRTMVPSDLVLDPNQAMEVATQEVLGRLPLNENPFFQGNVVDLFDLANHEFHVAALKAADGDGYLFQQVRWSPDGETLLAKMVRPSQPLGRDHPTIFFPDRAYFRFYDASLSEIGRVDHPEIEAALTTYALFVSPDEVIFAAPTGATFRLYSYQRQSGEFRQLPADEGTFAEAPYGYQIVATHHSGELIFNQSSFQNPPEIYKLRLDAGEPQALTAVNAAAAAVNQIRVDEVILQLTVEVTRTGYLVQPANAPLEPQAAPIVLFQQGGPGGPMTSRWGAIPDEPFNLLPNFGISILFMPFSGREGFGPEFFNRLVARRNFGAIDIKEAAQAVEQLIALGYTLPGQVGIAGCSYGGYFTSQSLVQYPDLYAAANAQCSPLDLFQWWESVGRLLISYAEGRLPANNAYEYRRDSPLYRAARIRTPLLMFHGEDDFLPVEPVRDFHDQVAATGTPVMLLTFQQEGHTLAHPASRSLAAQCQIAWFRKYLSLTAGETMPDETEVCHSQE